MKPLHILFLSLLLLLPTFAQDAAPPPAPPGPADPSLVGLNSLLDSLKLKTIEMDEIKEALKVATDAPTRVQLEARIAQLRAEEQDLHKKFQRNAIATDADVYDNESGEAFNLQSEVEKLLQPIVSELKSATEDSRKIEEMRSELTLLQKRKTVSDAAVANLTKLIKSQPEAELKKTLEDLLQLWLQRQQDANNQSTATQIELEKRLKARESLLDSSKHFVSGFFQSRGMNLILGISAFCIIFFGMRFLNMFYRKMRGEKEERYFLGRILSLLYHVLSIILAIFALVFIFNMRGDWFLLGITIIFLIGVGWASINTIPVVFEQLKMMLNIGSVRESHRIVFNDVPWVVDSLGLQAHLLNPLLEGGTQQLPLRDLVGMHSRMAGENEIYFPSKAGDWVELSDGNIGQVAFQTPAVVQIVMLGGSQVTYQTPQYLSLSPKNMSNRFRIRQVFGIDYAHQAISTSEVPRIMYEKVREGLLDIVANEDLLNLSVEFKAAGASSLDYVIHADLKGTVASKYDVLERAIARLLVDACNEHNWVIPFTQLTLHQSHTWK
ncbi:MAG: hypothetical protein ACI9TH_001486 [Kiritimatiellia bacterium]|jgi:hypothetical protein